jgi:hypothetical protein
MFYYIFLSFKENSIKNLLNLLVLYTVYMQQIHNTYTYLKSWSGSVDGP